MASDLPSIRTYMSPEDYAVISDCADAMGISRSALIRQMIEEAVPIFAMIVDMHRKASQIERLPAEAMRRVAEDLMEAQRHAELGREHLGGALRAVKPPTSNRGVTLS